MSLMHISRNLAHRLIWAAAAVLSGAVIVLAVILTAGRAR